MNDATSEQLKNSELSTGDGDKNTGLQCNSSLLTRVVRKQIENSLRESAPKAMDITNAVLELDQRLRQLSGTDDEKCVDQSIALEDDGFTKSVNAALVGLQFYDRLSQQLWQAIETLRELESMLDNGDQMAKDLDCAELAESARKHYPTESEREVFDRELFGPSDAWQTGAGSSDESGVELFD